MHQRLTAQTLRRLTCFAVIADAGSIREAARRMGLSVSSLSEALSDFESELGLTLAIRSTRRFQLTEEGRRVKRVADQMLAAGEQLFDEKDPLELKGQVALTAPVEIAQYWLPPVLQRFKQKHPMINLRISANDQVVHLAQSPMDIAIRAYYFLNEASDSEYPALPLTCVSAQDFTLEPVEDGWHCPQTLISAQPDQYLTIWDIETKQKKKIHFSGLIQVDNKHIALTLVERGLGAALIAELAANKNPSLKQIGANINFGEIRLRYILRDKHPSQAARALYESLTDVNRR